MTRIKLCFGRRSFLKTTLLGGALLTLVMPAFAKDLSKVGARDSQSLLTCSALPKLMGGYLSQHFSQRELTQELKERTIINYLKFLDSSKTFLLADEIDGIKKDLVSVFTMMNVGDCSKLLSLQSTLMARAQASEAFVKKTMANPKFKLDQNIELVTDPDKRPLPKTENDRLELVRKYLHFQYSNYLDSGSTPAEAKASLIHRYELITKHTKEQTLSDLFPLFINSFALSLDPLSGYFSVDDLEDFRISMGLSLEGIGASLTWKDGFTVVEEVIPGGAADRAKVLRTKDKIIAVGQDKGKAVPVIDMELRKVVSMIRGKKGTAVTLTILRQGKKTERFETRIIRDKIDLNEQAAKLSFREVKSGDKKRRVAVLDLPSFYGDQDRNKRSSYLDVKNILLRLQKEKFDGLVLDLSRNGGGLLDDAVRISGLFLQKGGIVATQIQNGKPEALEDQDESTFYSGPMVILQSRLSASASEILAGALKDYRRAVIVGDESSFGKGTVQSVLNLPPGLGAIKVTTGMFFRPGGQSTQKLGVVSDVVFPSRFADEEIGEASLDYSLAPKSIPSYLSAEANATEQQYHWNPVNEQTVEKLRETSKKRIQGSKEFQDILTENAKAKKEKNDVIKLSEMRTKQTKEKKEEEKSRAQRITESKEPQLGEAIQIMADYVNLTERLTLVETKK